MKPQQATKHLVNAIAFLIILCAPAWAQPFSHTFFDDFSDGDIQDGSPVSWQWVPAMNFTGESAVTAEGLELTPVEAVPYAEGAELKTLWRVAQDEDGRDLHYTGNMTIRAQVKLPESVDHDKFGSTAILALRANTDTGGCYVAWINRIYLSVARIDSYSEIHRNHDWNHVLRGDFTYTNQLSTDVIIQFDVIDLTDDAGNRTTSRLEARWWVAGDKMPEHPQLAFYDSHFDAGGVRIGATTDYEPNKTTIFAGLRSSTIH